MAHNVRFIVVGGSNTFPRDLDKGMGGKLRAILDLANALNVRGNMVQLVSYNFNNAPSTIIKEGLELVRINKWGFSYYLPLLFKLIKEREYQFEHVTNYPSALYLPKFCKRIVNVYDISWYPTWEHVHGIRKRADAVICCSDFVKDKFLKDFGYPPEKTYTVYNGVNVDRFADAEGVEVRKKFSIDENDIVVLYTGYMGKIKGVHHLINAFKNVSEQLNNIHLLVVGSPKVWGMEDKKAGYDNHIKKLSEGLRIHFTGEVTWSEIPQYYKACDIVAIPSIVPEGLPLVALEAMASGKPVIASNIGGIPEVIEDKVNGILVGPGNEEALADAIGKLASRDTFRKKMGHKGLVKSKDFSWNTIAGKVEDIYERILS